MCIGVKLKQHGTIAVGTIEIKKQLKLHLTKKGQVNIKIKKV